MLLQAYDFVELSRRYGVSLQLGKQPFIDLLKVHA